MIFTERTIKISNDVCKIDDPIVLYRGDYNVEVRFTIIESPFKYTTKNSTNIIEAVDASYGQLVIKVPNDGSPIFSDVVETKEGSVVFTLSREMIDESIEVGDYTFQIRLFDANKESRATIPPVENGISIREPIAFEDVTTTNKVGEATVGYALTTAATPEDAFDSQGNYNKTTWETGDRITAEKLNKIEQGITGVNDNLPHYKETLMLEISGEDFGYLMTNNYFNVNALNIDETNSYVGKLKMDINSNEEFICKYVYDKTNNALIDEISQTYIYNHKSYNGTNFIEDTNSAVITLGITPMSTVPEGEGYFRLYEIDKVKLDANCLPDNVSIPNSLTVGVRKGNIGEYSVAEGNENTASGESSHAEGEGTEATGNVSHAEGAYTIASGNVSHAEGGYTTASGDFSHAEGRDTTASGEDSHAEGFHTIASSSYQHVQGKFNIEDTSRTYAHIVGNGEADTARSNAHTLDWNGNAWYQGKLSQDGTPTEDKDLATKKYVDNAIENIQTSGGSNINDTTASATTTYSSNKIENIKDDLSSQINEIENQMDNITTTGGGLSYTAKKAILDLFSAVAYYNKDMTSTYQVLRDALLVAVDSITLDKTELTFTSATSQTLVATKSPVESEGTIVWTSSNPSVATVDNNGIVTATGNGECIITATCGSVYATCNVSVSGILQTYTITNNLTNVTTSNNITNIAEGTEYIATLTADSNYVISSIIITMGGEDITSTAYSNGSISISNVTGDVVITATAIEDVGWISGVPYALEWTDGYLIDINTGINKEEAGFSASNYLPTTNVDMLIVGNIYTNYGIFYYDENKSFLGRSESSFVVSNTNYDIPRNVRYVRVIKRLSESNAVVTPYDNEQLTENTEWKANNYYSLNWKDGVSLNTSTGVENTNADSAVSEFAFCYGANTLQFSSGNRTFIYFYNSNKEFLEYKIRQNATEPITIPETAQYFRITRGITAINYWVQLA